VRDPTSGTQRTGPGWVTEWKRERGALRVVDVDACAGSIIEVKTALDDTRTRRTTVARRELKPAAP